MGGRREKFTDTNYQSKTEGERGGGGREGKKMGSVREKVWLWARERVREGGGGSREMERRRKRGGGGGEKGR